MLNRWLTGVFVCAALLLGCSGSDSPSVVGDADYVRRAYLVIATDSFDGDSQSRQAQADALDQWGDDWEEVGTPAAVRTEHAAFLKAIRESADVFRALDDDEVVDPDSPEAMTIASLESAVEVWIDAVAGEYGVRPFQIEGASMEPTFKDRAVVFSNNYAGQPIARQDLIVFDFHLVPDDEGRAFFKRVLGVPGDVVEVRDGTVFVNGVAMDEGYILNTPTYTYGPRTVPADSYFVLGDNRRNSYDSHQWPSECGSGNNCEFVPAENVIGVLPADAEPYARTEEDSSD